MMTQGKSRLVGNYGRAGMLVVAVLSLSACVTSRIEDSRTGETGIREGEGVVIMAKSYHLGNETESGFINCVGDAISRGSSGLRVIPTGEFVDALFPWFEPRTAPADTKGLPELMSRPGVADIIRSKGVRYVIWLDGDTDRVAGGGSLSCAAGPGGGGCFGFAWWQNDANYEASVWDLAGLEDAGRVSADFSGTSFLPAIVVPIPLIARTQSRACKGLSDQLKVFIADDPV
ncbi:MAG: hypothetical protein OEW35_03445 [Gammaproteobacteria bacterium]|nr:hypothetical protein [Gammaproteobacteria bacterium]MDH4255687.1 hypothetical protein [Gammaproteobacteria bacterium]MDH5308718.1 hypothetical protein [Gammaproteobacteria bacterium]